MPKYSPAEHRAIRIGNGRESRIESPREPDVCPFHTLDCLHVSDCDPKLHPDRRGFPYRQDRECERRLSLPDCDNPKGAIP